MNRVTYKDKKLVKDSSDFHFEDSIFFNKANLQKIPHQSNCKAMEKEAEILSGWIESIEKVKVNLETSLEYLDSKEFGNLTVPSVTIF